MGWYFRRCSRDDLITELTTPSETARVRTDVIAHTVIDNVLWSVVRLTARQPGFINLAVGQSCSYIRCDLLDRHGDEWGYKPLKESMHPYYYTCPLAYLELAPVQCPEWRERVRAYHSSHTPHERTPVT
jgi:hypothetical protein